MKTLIWRRARILVPTLVLVTILVFSLQLIIPGGVAEALAGAAATPADLAEINHKLGLDRPIVVQYLDWVGGVIHGDFGTSFASGLPVTEVLRTRFASSIEVVVLGLIISIVIGGGLGMYSAIKRNSTSGRLVFATAGFGVSIPVFWASTICAGFFGAKLGWLPPNGWVPLSDGFIPHLKSVIMPAFLIALPTIALLARQVRSGMTTALDSPYVRTARAVGIGRKRIYFDLALRNGIAPVVAFLPVAIAGLVGELVIIDNVFVLPGLGSAITSAVLVRDFPTLEAIVLILAVTVLVVTLLADLILAAIDPRRRRELK